MSRQKDSNQRISNIAPLKIKKKPSAYIAKCLSAKRLAFLFAERMITDECDYLKGRQNCSRSTPRRTKTVIRSSLVFGGESHLRLRPQIFRYNEENKNGLKVSLECFGVVENAIAKALPVGFRFHTLNESLTLMGNLPYS